MNTPEAAQTIGPSWLTVYVHESAINGDGSTLPLIIQLLDDLRARWGQCVFDLYTQFPGDIAIGLNQEVEVKLLTGRPYTLREEQNRGKYPDRSIIIAYDIKSAMEYLSATHDELREELTRQITRILDESGLWHQLSSLAEIRLLCVQAQAGGEFSTMTPSDFMVGAAS